MRILDIDHEIEDSWREGIRMIRDELSHGALCVTDAMESIVATENGSRLSLDPWFQAIAREQSRGRDLRRVVGEPKYELGYVYLLHADNHHFKIGKATQVDRRISQIGLVVPQKITLVRAVLTDAMSFHERFCHSIMDNRKICGEWFRLSFWDFAYFFMHRECYYFAPDPDTGATDCLRSIARDYEFPTIPQTRYERVEIQSRGGSRR